MTLSDLERSNEDEEEEEIKEEFEIINEENQSSVELSQDKSKEKNDLDDIIDLKRR